MVGDDECDFVLEDYEFDLFVVLSIAAQDFNSREVVASRQRLQWSDHVSKWRMISGEIGSSSVLRLSISSLTLISWYSMTRSFW